MASIAFRDVFVVEGIDGSGKSTQLALLEKWLESERYGRFFSEWNSSALVRDVTRRGRQEEQDSEMGRFEFCGRRLTS